MASDDESGLLLRRSGKPTHISITLAFSIAVVIGVAQAGWFGSSYSSRITASEKTADSQAIEIKAVKAEIDVVRQQQQTQQIEVAKALTNIVVQLENLNTNMSFVKQQLVSQPVRQTR